MTHIMNRLTHSLALTRRCRGWRQALTLVVLAEASACSGSAREAQTAKVTNDAGSWALTPLVESRMSGWPSKRSLTAGEAKAQQEATTAKAAPESAALTKARAAAAKAVLELPAARSKLAEERQRFDAAEPALSAAMAACEKKHEGTVEAAKARVVACEGQAAAGQAAAQARLTTAAEACNQRAGRTNADCQDNCASVATKCRLMNWDRPNAKERCNTTGSECNERCGTAAEQACQSLVAQAEKGQQGGGLDSCGTLRQQAEKLETGGSDCFKLDTVALAKLAAAANRVAELEGLVAEPERLVAEAKTAQEDMAHCKAVGRAAIPAGTFTMGDASNTSKAGQVTVSAYCMDRAEVTTAAYATCVKSGKCTAADAGKADNSCNAGVTGRGNHPINCVDWTQATAYCAAQGQRLPTEEEWEYAARGTDGRIYPWGNAEPAGQLCWNGEGNSLGKDNRNSTCAVASFPAGNSPFGLSDMSGNVLEWTSSAYNGGADRVYRGGNWLSDGPSFVRSAFRWVGPSNRDGFLGFRCAGSFFP